MSHIIHNIHPFDCQILLWLMRTSIFDTLLQIELFPFCSLHHVHSAVNSLHWQSSVNTFFKLKKKGIWLLNIMPIIWNQHQNEYKQAYVWSSGSWDSMCYVPCSEQDMPLKKKHADRSLVWTALTTAVDINLATCFGWFHHFPICRDINK